MAVCTAALGGYVIAERARSLRLGGVLTRHRDTPAIRNTSTPKIKTIAIAPAFHAYSISTITPISTNNKISAPAHSSENF